MTTDSSAVDDELWSEVREHFDEGETVELAVAIGLFNYFNIFNNTMRMEPTK
jgi:alkylhydroperoxidase family enzyme